MSNHIIMVWYFFNSTIGGLFSIKNEPLIKAIIAGHTHRNFEEFLTDTLPQFTTDGSFAGYVREITIT